jgi:hypothetical protein
MPTYDEMYPDDSEPKSEPIAKTKCVLIEAALSEIGSVALKGKRNTCSACGHRQGYIFYASDVRAILYKLLRRLT